MSEIDLTLAIQLQAQFEEELRVSLLKQLAEEQNGTETGPAFHVSQRSKNTAKSLEEPPKEKLSVSLVDPSWDLIDPNPDIRSLFLTYNDQFFWGRLAGVEVKWSPRMTLCAGVCSYEGRGGLCSVRLSLPLLKLRPRKDLVETLLHEMIHAYLFVTANNRDRDGHGPEFHKHMYRINGVAGTNITVFHTFHDEVDVYRQHIWQCDGPCRTRRPYFGLLKRSMNRAPGPRDPWWEQHRQTCGGSYTKIQEPEGYGAAKKGKSAATSKKLDNCGDIRKFIEFTGKGDSPGGGYSGASHSKDKASANKKMADRSESSKENTPEPGVGRWARGGTTGIQGEDSKKQNNVHGFASTETAKVNQVRVTGASHSNVHGFGGHSPARKKHCGGGAGQTAAGGGTRKKTPGNFGGGLAMKGGGSRTVTVKGKIGTGTSTQNNENNVMNRSSEMVNGTVTHKVFQGQGHSLGGSGTSISRLLSLSASSQSQIDSSNQQVSSPSSAQHSVPRNNLRHTSNDRKECNSKNTSGSPAGDRTPQKLQKSLDCYMVSPSSSQHDKKEEKFVRCPVCDGAVLERVINKHLDECVGNLSDNDEMENETEGASCDRNSLAVQKEPVSVRSNGVEESCSDRKRPDMNPHEDESEVAMQYPCPVCSELCTQATINLHLDLHF